MSHLSFITSIYYWLKSVPLHLHFTICNSVQWLHIILWRFICQKWTSQTLHTMQLHVFTAYSVSIYTHIYILIAVNTSINQPCSHQKCFLDAIIVYSERNDQNVDTYGDSPMPAVRKHACRHSDTMRVRGTCELHFSTRKYWTCSSVSLICMPAHQSTLTTALTKTRISRQESFFFTFTWLKSTRLLKQKQRRHQRAYLERK